MSVFALILVIVSTILLTVPMVIVNTVAAATESSALYANWFYAVEFFTGLFPRLILQGVLIYGLVGLFRGVKLSRRASSGIVLLAISGIIVPYVGMTVFGDMPQWLLFSLNSLFFCLSLPLLALGILAVRARA
jgi:hypothetical protein